MSGKRYIDMFCRQSHWIHYIDKPFKYFIFSSKARMCFTPVRQIGNVSKLKYYEKSKLSVFGIGICLSLGFGIHSLIDKKKLAFPTLFAAKGFLFTSDESTSDKDNSDTSKTKRNNYNFIADAVEKVSHGVVYIEIKDLRRRDINGNYLTMSNGSGFIVSEDGLILTNAHVVTNRPRSSSIIIRLQDNRELQGTLEEIDAVSDLALVKIKCNNLTPVKLGSSSDLRPGEFVVALGSPLSLCNTITAGVVSSIGRHSKDLGLRGRDIDYIQTDAAITFGNSGGPLVNLDGEVIGINSMKVTSGISFAIPVDHAKVFLNNAKKKQKTMEEFKDKTSARRRYLGITMLTLTPEILLELQTRGAPSTHNIPPDLQHGILIWRVVVGSPAHHAGLHPGDIITHINGHDVHSSRDVYSQLDHNGDLRLVVIRGGQRFSITVSPED